MKSSAGSDAFAIVALAVICLFVLLLLRYYLPLRTTPAYLAVPVFLALALPLSIFLLVPIDLASSSRHVADASRGIWLPNKVILVAWRLTYWLTFALTWFILPLLGEYVDSGYRSPKDRILYSIRSNGRYQLIMLMCAGGGAIYVFLMNGFKGGSVKSLVMALAYCWGLMMAIYLMGHGLVAVPRKLFRNANPTDRLRRIQCQAPQIKEKLTDALGELEELEGQLFQLRRRKNAVSRDHEEWIEDLSEHTSIPDSRVAPATSNSSPAMPAVITDRYLGEFSRKLMRARHKRTRFLDTWNGLLRDAEHVQALVDALASRKLVFDTSERRAGSKSFSLLTPYMRYLLHLKLLPAFRILAGSLLTLASGCIIWSELVKFVAPQLTVVGLTVLSHRGEEVQVAFGGQVLAAFWLLYMSIATLASFDDVKIWGNRALVRRNTYGESATWYSTQVAKLTVPLAYNFITFLPPTIHEETQFYQFLGRLINLTPLGKYFDYFFPIFILVPVSATLFNLYGRIKRLFGFEVLSDEEESASADMAGGWREGRDLIARELTSSRNLGLTGGLDGSSTPPSSTNRGLLQPGPVPDRDASGLRPQVARQSTYAQQQADRLAEATAAAEEEDESFFQGFAHRVKNTIDSVERPDWMNDLGKRPKWMNGLNGNSGEGPSQSDSVRGFAKWFRGRPSDGQIRL